MARHSISQPAFAQAAPFVLPGAFAGAAPLSFLVHCVNGQFHLQVTNPRSTMEDVARYLRTDSDGVSYLVSQNHLRPLGTPTGNKQKFFSTEELFQQMRDRKWLSKITNALYEYNENKNTATKKRREQNRASSDNSTASITTHHSPTLSKSPSLRRSSQT